MLYPFPGINPNDTARHSIARVHRANGWSDPKTAKIDKLLNVIDEFLAALPFLVSILPIQSMLDDNYAHSVIVPWIALVLESLCILKIPEVRAQGPQPGSGFTKLPAIQS